MSSGIIKKDIKFSEEFIKSSENIPKEEKKEFVEIEILQDTNKIEIK